MMSNPENLNTAVIYGSARRSRQGIKAARFVVRMLEERKHDVTLIDSEKYDLPMLDWMYKEYESGQAPEAMQKLAEILSAAQALFPNTVLATEGATVFVSGRSPT